MPETNIILYINYISIKNNLKRKEKLLILLNQIFAHIIKGFPCGSAGKESTCSMRDLC